MFDIAFSELVLVSLVALLVIGPERLPETIRTIMLWIGRIRRTFTNIKSEIEQEIGADEIRRQLHNETILKEINESKNQIQNAIKEADDSVNEFKKSVTDSVTTANQSENPEVSALDTSAAEIDSKEKNS